MLKLIRWCAASLLAVAATSAVMADDDSLLEKALAPERKEAVIEADAEPAPAPPALAQPADPAQNPDQPSLGQPSLAQPNGPAARTAPAIGNPPAPNAAAPAIDGAPGARVALGGGAAIAGTVVAAPAPRVLFMGAVGVGPFGEPIGFVTPRICVAEAVFLKGAICGAPIGRVVLQVDQLIFDAEIVDWAENGVQAVLPTVAMLGPTHAMLHVIRADGVLADTLPIVLTPAN